MPDRIAVPKPDGTKTLGDEVDVETAKENWNEYQLADGTKLRLRLVVHQVVRLDDRTADGDPVYVVRSSNILEARVPEILKARGKN